MKKIRLHNKDFEVYIPAEKIRARLYEMATALNKDLAGKDIVFLGILNGAFIFAADLVRLIDLPCSVSFAKLASYQGDKSTGKIHELIGIAEHLEGKCVVIIEDIIDTGLSMDHLVEVLQSKNPSEIHIAALLFKQEAHIGKILPDYVGFSIPNQFVVGYGLDFDGKGRNLEDIYIRSSQEGPVN
jgi:hypoxanthine phosphoribosyltransferase